jgi:hypothetical protein
MVTPITSRGSLDSIRLGGVKGKWLDQKFEFFPVCDGSGVSLVGTTVVSDSTYLLELGCPMSSPELVKTPLS